jgi:tetratricopeptide (TPR) repeat protein
MTDFLKVNKHLMRGLTYFIILLAAMLSYFPTFSGEFILDDKSLIEHNQYITGLHSLQSYFMQEDGALDTTDPEAYHTGYYRPLINLSYWLDYRIWGMWAPGFRTTNLIFHILCCMVLYHFLGALIGDRRVALWLALVFTVHPVNTEAVSWVSSRNNILATLFALSAHSVYIRAQEKRNKTPFLILSAIFYGGAVLSKEFGVMLLPILFLYKRVVRRTKSRLTEDVIELIPFIVFLLFYFILRQKATGSLLTPEGFENVWRRIAFTPYLIASNLKMILFPYNLHSYILTYPDGYLSWQMLFGFSVIILMGCLVFRYKENRLIVYSILSFIIALFPILNIVPTSGVSLFSMRWLYFPMVFLTPAFAVVLKSALMARRSLSIAVSALIVAYLGAYSVFLNRGLWHDEKTFFEVEIHRFNNSYYAYGCALNYLKLEDYEEAEKYFKIAVNGYHSSRSKTQIDYAAFLNDMGRPDEALLYLKKAKLPRLWPKEEEEWHRCMGVAFLKLNRAEEALPYLELAVEYGPDDPVNWANLGAAFSAMGMYTKSVDALNKGLEIDFDAVGVRKNLAIAYKQMGNYEKANEVLSNIPPQEVEGRADIKRLIDEVQTELGRGNF